MDTITITNKYDEEITIKIGDWVGFKSDIEQAGKVTAIHQGQWLGNYILRLENKNGFSGGYIGGNTTHNINAKDCDLG